MTSTRYTLEELSVEASLLPAHVDPSRLEDYLRDDEFIKVCFNKAVYTPPQSQTGGQEQNSDKSHAFCFGYRRTDGPTQQGLESRVRD